MEVGIVSKDNYTAITPKGYLRFSLYCTYTAPAFSYKSKIENQEMRWTYLKRSVHIETLCNDLLSVLIADTDENKCGSVAIKVVFLTISIPYLKIQSNNIVIYHHGILATIQPNSVYSKITNLCQYDNI